MSSESENKVVPEDSSVSTPLSVNSDSTVLYEEGDDSDSSGKKLTRDKKDLGDDSDSNSSTSRKTEEKTDAIPKNQNREKNQSDDDEDKELEKLLRMTETYPLSRPKSSEKQEERKSKKVIKSKEKEISLLDCLESENFEESTNSETVEENTGNDFLSMINDQVKNVFLQTSEESCHSSTEEEEKEMEKFKKVLKKKEVKEKNEEKEQKNDKKKDELRQFRLNFPESSEEDIIEDSDDSIKCVQVKSKKQDSYDEQTVDSGSSSDIQQVYSKTESSPTKGRKNIKKILKKENLQVETKQALKMETERKKRVAERKKLFEQLFPNASADSELILDFDQETKKQVVVVDESLSKQLKPHQREGVRFMWDNCFESVKRLEEDSGSGCILAHCMGLGKTLQVITLVHTVMTHDLGVHTVLIVCPLSTVSNWIREFRLWQRPCVKKIKPFDLIPSKTKEERLARIKLWMREGGVLIISYGLFQSLTKDTRITEIDPDLVVCDEGHLLKNRNSERSKCMSKFKTLRRIVLTGTPLQNNLMEYYCMVQFVKPNILGTVQEFKNRFFHPINNGQFEDSTQHDVKIMKRRAHVLHSMLDGFIQRLGYSVLKPFLPEKQEYVISIALTETQESIYRMFIKRCNQELLKDFQWLQMAWTHPWVLNAYVSKRGDDAIKSLLEKHLKESDFTDIRSGGKLHLLFCILKRCRDIGDKVLVFSQSLMSLDLIEFFLRNPQNRFGDSWVLGEDYFRLDGSTSIKNRNSFFQKFNDVNNKRFRLFLASTKAGGLGVNLVAANRVIVFDVSWNPTHDVQSIFRVYRFGQKKPCFIYRFLAAATMEEKIYKRQVTKLSLAHRILDEHQIERHYTMGNLQELYTYDPIPRSQWKIPKLPKDGLFADLLSKDVGTIVGYHEHDSLLENKEEEELTEEDRKAAWEDYEKEKLIPQPSVLNGIPMEPSLREEIIRNWTRTRQGVTNVSDNDKPLFKIVNVRTLNNKILPKEVVEMRRVPGVPRIPEVPGVSGGFSKGPIHQDFFNPFMPAILS